jgi:predicted nuclease of restriction endonuclease-like (RecB) superfamily
MLVAQMESKLYQRQGKAIHNFQATLPAPQADLASETLKNPYNFDFLVLGKEARERDLESALTHHIKNFLLELGQGFAYMGRQFPISVAGADFYLDLLFYHTRLRCYIVVELKASEFKPEYAGKINFYLNAVNAQYKHSQDQPTIGILLCKTPNKVVVEYALENISSPLGVSEYQIMNTIPDKLKGELPTIEELEMELGGGTGSITRNI